MERVHRNYGRNSAELSCYITHTHRLRQKWCVDHFPDFIPKSLWMLNSLDLCPLDYSLWNDLAETMNWDRATAKDTLTDEIKRSVKKNQKRK